MRFEAREVKPFAEPVTLDSLREGEVYFSVQFIDDQMIVPIVGTWVFAGEVFDPELQDNRLIFQDAESHRQGVRYGSPNEDDGEFQLQQKKYINHIFEYENALNVLLSCSLRRQKIRGST
jgi:hypothetical protein